MPSSGVFLRNASVEDAPALAEFATRTFRQTFNGTASEKDIEEYVAEAYREAVQQAEMAACNSTVIFAEIVEPAPATLVGFAYIIADQRTAATELSRIYVDEAWLGKGIARLLLAQAMLECRRKGSQRLWLNVWHRNERAIAFYKKVGFRVVGDMSFAWGEGDETGYVMELSCE